MNVTVKWLFSCGLNDVISNVKHDLDDLFGCLIVLKYTYMIMHANQIL